MENIQDNWQSSLEWKSQKVHPKVRPCNAQGNYKHANREEKKRENMASVSMLNLKFMRVQEKKQKQVNMFVWP